MLFGKNFYKYYFKYIHLFIVGILVLVVVNMLQLEIPELFGKMINGLYEIEKYAIDPILNPIPSMPVFSDYLPIIQRILILGMIIMVGRFLWRYTIFGASRKIENDLRNVMFNHATILSQDFYSHEKVGGLMTYFINDLEALRMAFGPGVLVLIDGVVLGSLAIRKMYKLHATMTLYALIPMGLLMIVMVFINKSMTMKFRKRQKAFEKLSDFTQESFSGITVIKAYVKEIKEAMFFQIKSNELYDKNLSFIKHSIVVQILIGIALNIVTLLIIAFGGYLVIEGGLTPGDLTAYISYFFTLIWPVMALAQFVNINAQAQASAKRVNEFLNKKPSVVDANDVIYDQELSGHIVAKGLTFKYPDGQSNVLDSVSFEIKPGQMVGVLGRTGSGKSSLIELLLRFYNVEENSLFIDGIDIMKLPIKDVRELVGYVPQDNFLFSDTIENNIGFSFIEQDFEKVKQAAELSDVDSNIMEFKEKYNTVLGERGVTVSGGQKQRISIARALAKDPQILILDDSVSAVDTKTEESIINNLFKVRKNKTTIFIAHRISTVKKMDLIILLDDGKVVAKGNHEQLLKESPLYQEMVRLQTLENMIMEDN